MYPYLLGDTIYLIEKNLMNLLKEKNGLKKFVI